MKNNNIPHDPADDASHDDVREELYQDLHEDETTEEMLARIEREAYAEAARKLLPVVVAVLNYVSEGDDKSVFFRLAVASHYFGHPRYAGKSMSEICHTFGKTRAAGSAASLKFQRENKLPELLSQKSAGSRVAYYAARKNAVKSNN